MAFTQSITGPFQGRFGKPYGPFRPSGGTAVAFGHNTNPFITAYPWVNDVGFGTKYAAPGTAVPGQVNDVIFNSGATVIFLAHVTSPFMTAYAWSRNNGFGTKFANPGTVPPGTGLNIAFRRFGSGAFDHIATGNSIAPLLNAWRFSRSGAGWSTKFTAPAFTPTAVSGVNFSPIDKANLAVSGGATPFITAYPWSDTGFGTKYANPAVVGTSSSNVRFSKLGDALIVSQSFTSSSIIAWAFANGFGTKYADPSFPPSYAINADSLDNTNGAVMTPHDLTASFDQCVGWHWSDALGFGTRYALLTRIPAAGEAIAYNPDASAVFRSLSTANRISARHWTDTNGFSTEYAAPGTLPTNSPLSVAVAP